MQMRAIIPGTFDPITFGHLDIIKRAAGLFDEVIVGVALSAPKRTLFTHEERIGLARSVTDGIPNVKVEGFSTLLVDFASDKGCKAIVKGLRAITDFEYEFQMSALNSSINPAIDTAFIMSSPEYMFLSSSAVRELASFGADVSKFVPETVGNALAKKFEMDGKPAGRTE